MAGLATAARLKPPDALFQQDSAVCSDQDLFSYRNLLQELLMALLGYTGDVFLDAAELRAPDRAPPALQHPAVCTVRLSGDLPWIEPRDRQLLDRIVALGFHFKQLRLFVEQERGAAPRSAYRQALCSGITGARRAETAALWCVRQQPARGAPIEAADRAAPRTRGGSASRCRRATPYPLWLTAPCLPRPPETLTPGQSSWVSIRTKFLRCSSSCSTSQPRGWRRCSTSCCPCRCRRVCVRVCLCW